MTALTKIEKFQVSTSYFDDNQIELIKNSICKNASHEELQFFLMACQRSGLDPFARQIYSVPRAGQRTIQTGVDGFRLIADRTGKYTPGREPTFEYDKNGNLFSATSYVMKQTKDGTWHEVSANAHWSEYNPSTPIWRKMPRLMLAKCAECLALRKAFPAEMSGIYAKEEMDQADYNNEPFINVEPPKKTDVKPLDIEKISMKQAVELGQLLAGCSETVKLGFAIHLKNAYSVSNIEELPTSEYVKIKNMLVVRFEDNQKELLEKEMAMTGDNVEVLE